MYLYLLMLKHKFVSIFSLIMCAFALPLRHVQPLILVTLQSFDFCMSWELQTVYSPLTGVEIVQYMWLQ